MAFVIADRVQETTIVVGTGTATLLGAAIGYQSFSAGIGASNTTYYVIADQSGSNWEVGFGTLDATGLILTRTTILSSSNSNSVVSFPAGTKNVWCDYPAKKAALQDSLGLVTVPVLQTSSTSSVTPVLTFNGATTNYAAGVAVSGSYLQTILQNSSATAGASTNYVLSNNLGTDSTYYGEFGMNSSVFSASTPSDFFSINNGVYFSGHDGDITVGSGNGFKYYMAWGTAGQSAHVINATGAIGLSTNLGTTPALSGTTGFGTSGQVLTSAGSSASPTWTTPTTGTVTSVSGTTGRITSTGGTTPVIDLASGVATAGTTGSSTLIPVVTIDTYGRVTSITTAANPQGTVTSVTGTAPVVSSGGATPAISMAAATTSVNGYLTSTDWNTFNGKSPAAGSSSITTTGTVTSGTWSASFGAVSGANLTNITGANVTGTVANATTAVTVSGATQASITSAANLATVGTITSGTWSGSFGAVSGANLTSLNASNLSSGTVGTARLGSGTASSSTYLRGDQTWATISAGAPGGSNTQVQYNSSGSFAGSANFTFDGTNILVAGTVSGGSDERLKTNWRNVQDNYITKLANVKAGIFDRTDLNITQPGVSAQSLREVLPEAVLEDENGMLSVNYGGAALLSVIELAKEIVALRVELEALKYPRTGA